MTKPLWYDEIFEDKSRLGLNVTEVLYQGRSDLQQIDVLETKAFGRVLVIDQVFMTSERDEHFYHEMIVHPPLTTSPGIRRILVIGGGDGGTVREVLSYPEVEQVVMVEIDAQVVEVSKQFLPTIGRAWDDPRLEVIIGDGIDYAKNADVEPYDVILLDGCDPVGPAEGLFTEDFYRDVARLLKRDGVFALQSESPILQRDVFLDISAALTNIFDRVYPYFGPVPLYAAGIWSWIFASQTVGPFGIIDDRVERQESRCKYYNRDIHRAAFAVPNDLKPVFKRALQRDNKSSGCL
ncbi:MAG: polyamine aminopropyltransferase [Deltaproteobacteria bacterium]|nr:polyamine aminopropyltransferase [Deltaproteobacteria bacterium]